MKDFDKLCKEFEHLDPLEHAATLALKSAKLIPALSALSEDGIGGVELLADFVLCSIVADGKLSEEEFLLMKPMMDVFFGADFNYDECKQTVKLLHRDSSDFKRYLDAIADMLGQLSDELKDDIVIVCLLICSIDGKISLKEKNWIRRLIK